MMHGSLGRALLLKLAYPGLMLAGAFMKDSRERFQAWVVRLNNSMVLRELRGAGGASRILLLLPHCLQISKCDIRLTYDVRNCKRCGRCGIKELIEISEGTGCALHVATGGNLARRIVKDLRPDAVVAVACERDLSSGIVDTYPLPVYGVCNERPEGPCINTRVNMDRVREAVMLLVRRGGE